MIKLQRLVRSLAVAAIISSCTSGVQAPREVKGKCTEKSCIVSMIKLIAAPSEYNGKRITIRGYFASSGILALYPTEINYRMGDFSSSIGFRIPMSQQKEWVDSGFLYEYVEVNGIIDTSSHGFDDSRFADFVTVYAIGPIRMIEKKEDDHNFGVGIEFLNK